MFKQNWTTWLGAILAIALLLIGIYLWYTGYSDCVNRGGIYFQPRGSIFYQCASVALP